VGGTSLGAFEQILRTNLTGVFLTVQATVPYLNEGGSIVLVGSVHAELWDMPGMSAYAASKAGIRAMARVLGAELAPRRIRVNSVTPGATRTPIWDSGRRHRRRSCAGSENGAAVPSGAHQRG